jgi:hypothetical protein
VFALDGGTIPNYSAKMWQMLSPHFSPDDGLTRQRLIELRRRLNWSRAMASAVLATAEGSIAKWEDIRLDKEYVAISETIAKKHRARNVDIMPNAIQWPHRLR